MLASVILVLLPPLLVAFQALSLPLLALARSLLLPTKLSASWELTSKSLTLRLALSLPRPTSTLSPSTCHSCAPTPAFLRLLSFEASSPLLTRLLVAQMLRMPTLQPRSRRLLMPRACLRLKS
ncbi:hypothetical protein B0J15DRAFT_476994 [Fusarium solani]|uniref:Secreted protein n=1 Tax=Fusarium solani TaxID=169388 RepID=A0A9P9L397_FUSSL|nr:uncharacterized protein B0J15DRAFT_476994 [Fusarium solani]KAH7273361.1 hypothetical protein B0J15DRAFT_476994 [Fusarium solani]